jgi:hypothetical protein
MLLNIDIVVDADPDGAGILLVHPIFASFISARNFTLSTKLSSLNSPVSHEGVLPQATLSGTNWDRTGPSHSRPKPMTPLYYFQQSGQTSPHMRTILTMSTLL